MLTQTDWCRAIDQLTTSQSSVLIKLYGLKLQTEPRTTRQIAQSLRVSIVKVQQDLDRAIKALFCILQTY